MCPMQKPRSFFNKALLFFLHCLAALIFLIIFFFLCAIIFDSFTLPFVIDDSSSSYPISITVLLAFMLLLLQWMFNLTNFLQIIPGFLSYLLFLSLGAYVLLYVLAIITSLIHFVFKKTFKTDYWLLSFRLLFIISLEMMILILIQWF
jgi:hypothetical protein